MEEFLASFFSVLMFLFWSFIVLIVLFILGVIAKIFYSNYAYKKSAEKVIEKEALVCLFIKILPTNNKKEDAMAVFLHSLHRIMHNNTFLSLEMASFNQFLRFYMVVPRVYKSVIESQLYAQFPEAEVEETPDYLPDFDKNSAFAELVFKKSSIHPIKTYQQMEEDLLKNLSAILSKTESGEQIFFQLALKRVGSKFWQRGFKATHYKMLGKKGTDESPHPAHAKLSQDLFIGRIRLAYKAEDPFVAKTKLDTLARNFKSVKSSYNELKIKKRKYSDLLAKSFKARRFKSGNFWHVAEIAAVYHFPYGGSITSNVVHTTSKRAPAPDILPREGIVDPRQVSFIGETNYRNERFKFGLKRFDRRRHLYIIGKTGSGKSRLLELLLISDIQSGQGCCLLDPHGDLVDEMLKFVPKDRIGDVIYINPSDRDFPIGFNPLEPVDDYETRQHLARFLISIFKKLFAGSWNDRMEHLIRYITLALLETPDSNIMGIPRMLSDTAFRQRVIRQLQDPVVKSFWTNEFSTSNEQFLNDAAIPILNKVGQFISNPIIRNMIGQQRNSLNFDEFMNSGKIVMINVSKGKLGDDNAALLGSMFITKIQQAALSRSKMPEEERRDFYFYVDEFQNFATEAFSSILSEARKYRLDLTIAHQYMAQLPSDVRATAFGNIGTIISFAIGGDDAAYLQKEFAPTFTADDMINLNTREMYIRMSVDGRIATPFSARTLSVPKPTFDYTADILNHSRNTYGRNRVEVENEIKQWSQADSFVPTAGEVEQDFPEPII